MPRKNQCYGWVPDLPDHRDYFYVVPFGPDDVLPASVDLRDNCPPVYDQGKLGSCTANAIAGASARLLHDALRLPDEPGSIQ
jgi:hypothetical protein